MTERKRDLSLIPSKHLCTKEISQKGMEGGPTNSARSKQGDGDKPEETGKSQKRKQPRHGALAWGTKDKRLKQKDSACIQRTD